MILRHTPQSDRVAFHGQPNDEVGAANRTSGFSGLYFYGYRYLDTQLGRWLSRDPIGEGGKNLYSFVENSGANRSDYLGFITKLSLDDSGIVFGNCGAFSWRIQFILEPRAETGVILQEVNAFGFYSEYDDLGKLIQKSIRIGPEVNLYFEIWDVGPITGGEAIDTFSIGVGKDQLRNITSREGFPNTKGEFEITGWARYYPGIDWYDAVGDLKKAGWSNNQDQNKTWAGSLWAGPQNPGWRDQGKESSGFVMRTISVEWDCCKKTNPTKLVKTKSKPKSWEE